MALSPINYSLNAADPAQRVLQGAQFGQGLISQAEQRGIAQNQNARAQAAEGRAAEMFPLQMQQAELGIQEAQLGLQAQRQRLEAQRAQTERAQALQDDLRGLIELGTKATEQDFLNFNLKYPEQSEATTQYFKALDENRQRPLVATLAQAATALKGGDVETGLAVATRFADAARASGDAQLADMAEATVELARANPDAAFAQIGTLLSQVDPDLAKTVLSGAQEEPAGVTSLRIRAKEAGLEPGSDEYRQFMLSGGAEKGIAIEVGPDGTVRFAEGGAGDSIFGDKPPTEGQLASAGYLQRMRGAEDTFAVLEAEGVTRIPFFAGQTVGTAAENLTLSGSQRRLLQAQRDWVRSKLRKESGAVIGDEEMISEMMTYFPQPGDSEAVVEQKRQARQRADRQMEIAAGPASPLAKDEDDTPNDPIAEQAKRFKITKEEAQFVFDMQQAAQRGERPTPEQQRRLQEIRQKMVAQ